jgi:hypothetical protein
MNTTHVEPFYLKQKTTKGFFPLPYKKINVEKILKL